VRTNEPLSVKLELSDDRAVATMCLPGMGAGATVTRSGRDEREALSATLRALADLVDNRHRAAKREGDTTWVRVSLDVDVKVAQAEADRAETLEKRSMNGDRQAAAEEMSLAMSWIAAALHDEDARDWQSFSWSFSDDCEDFNLA
jgi:hypothetical protein